MSGRDAEIADVGAAYGRMELAGRGRVAFDKERNAIEMLVRASAPPGAAPYSAAMLPGMALGADVLATADDPRAIAARGVLWGSSATQRLDALFDVDANGSGSVGPVELHGRSGSLYARVALGGPKGGTFGVVEARDFAIAPLHDESTRSSSASERATRSKLGQRAVSQPPGRRAGSRPRGIRKRSAARSALRGA